MNDTNRPLAVGDTLHGFCGGAFGRDHYDCCTIEALGPDWVVTRDANGGLDFTGLLDRLPAHRQPTTDVNGNPCCDTPPCTHPIKKLGLDPDWFHLICRACGTVIAERVGDERVPDFSWVVDCPEPRCGAAKLTPCRRWNGSASGVSHGRRWAKYDATLRPANT